MHLFVTILVVSVLCLQVIIGSQSNSVKDYLRKISKQSTPTPVVLWHGMGDSCCNPISLGWVKKLLEREIKDIYVHSLMIGDNFVSDTLHGYFGNLNDEIDEACSKIANDVHLKDGYNAIGFSQGGLFLRGLAQRCSTPPMKNLISIGGPQQGIYGLPYCPGNVTICDTVRHLLDWGAYAGFVQRSSVQAQYWHDPTDAATYREASIFLADINAENAVNQTYVDNLKKLNNLVLIKFNNDSMIVPKESEWFGYYKDGDTSSIIPLEESKLFTEDRIGLKAMKDSGKVQFLAMNGDHLEIPESVFIDEIINKFLK